MAFLIRVPSRGPFYVLSQIRSLSNCSMMKKGLVLGVYDTEDSNCINLTPAAQKYNEYVNGKLVKYIQRRD